MHGDREIFDESTKFMIDHTWRIGWVPWGDLTLGSTQVKYLAPTSLLLTVDCCLTGFSWYRPHEPFLPYEGQLPTSARDIIGLGAKDNCLGIKTSQIFFRLKLHLPCKIISNGSAWAGQPTYQHSKKYTFDPSIIEAILGQKVSLFVGSKIHQRTRQRSRF